MGLNRLRHRIFRDRRRPRATCGRSVFLWIFLFLAPLRPCLAERIQPASPTIDYLLRLDGHRPNHFSVRITAPRPDSTSISFAIPAWTPGYYQILHFEAGIDRVRARDEAGHDLPIRRADARIWTVGTSGTVGRTICLTYDVAGMDKGLGFFGSALHDDLRIGYVNGASAFMYVVGMTQAPVSLSILAPRDWKQVTPLTPAQTAGTYSASTYDELVDSPIQLGEFYTFEFHVGPLPVRCVLAGSPPVNAQHVSAVLRSIVQEAIGLFGSAPFDHYVFFYHIGHAGFNGGLEHRNSSVIHLLSPIGDGDDDEFVTTSAHELFHAWNVKYLRPQGLGPFDYNTIVRTRSLWFAEGVTDYYADLLTVRAGLRTVEWFDSQMWERIRQLNSTPSRGRITLEQASYHAWEGQSEGYEGMSYYVKGSLVGFYFDLRIRSATGGDRSLDDVLRELARLYGRRNMAYPESAPLDALRSVCSVNLTSNYNTYVCGTQDIDWHEVFLAAGFRLLRDRLDEVPDSALTMDAFLARRDLFTTRAVTVHDRPVDTK